MNVVELPLRHVNAPGALEQVDPALLDAFLVREGGAHLVSRGRMGSVGLDADWLRRALLEVDEDYPVRLADALAHVDELTVRLASVGHPSALEHAIRLWMQDSARMREVLEEPVRMYRRAPTPAVRRSQRRVRVAGAEPWAGAGTRATAA